MPKPKVTVILTSFNHAKYLREAIDSVLHQTFQDYEFIIWDDASSDNSWEIIKSYSDPRIVPFRNETSQRGIFGINKSISEIAKGEYIAIHHSDDIWQPDKLEKQFDFLQEHSQYGAVFTNALAIGEESKSLQQSDHHYTTVFTQPNRTRYEWLYHFFSEGNALCHPSVMIRKECYSRCGLYRYGFAQLADFDMWVRLCMKYEIFVLPEKLIKFRVRDNEKNSSGNTSKNRARISFEFYTILKNYLNIDTYEEFTEVFELAKKYQDDEVFLKEFIYGMILLESGILALAKLLGLELILEQLNNPSRAKLIKEKYDFDYLNLVELSAKHGVANLSSRDEDAMRDDKQRLETEIDLCEGKINRLQDEIIQLKSSASWILTKPLRIFAKR
tara:strand:+ start:4330 stop:5490 length:1161 start_codon:yes stop_codon:yes gene_type:complete